MDWVNFHFESNQVFGLVESPHEWRRVKSLYELAYEGIDIYSLRENLYLRTVPDFGQRREHKGDRTLGDFFDQNGMTKI